MESFIQYDIQLYDHIRFYDVIALTTLVCKLLVSYWIVCTVMPYIIIICSFKCGVWGYLIFLNFGKYKYDFYLYIWKIHKQSLK